MARVLIVDDDTDSCDRMARVIRKRGHHVVCVQSPRSAMALLIGDTPDFAIFDFLMPEMNGLDLLRAIRSYLRLQQLPVLIVTAYPESPELLGIDELEVLGVMSKVNLQLSDMADLIDEQAKLL